jgi:Putative GTPase activating protein for Arf
MEKPELMLKKLRRLESNMRCPNCGTPAQPGIGFGNVCVKFKTFVCDLCKTSHQAISHRVKSFSMSTWTMEEVMELTSEQNGGNQVALHVWLGNAPGFGERYPGGFRPKEGDKVETFKQFITDCYERGKFKSSTPFDASSVISDTEHATPRKKRSEERIPVSAAKQHHQKPTHAPATPTFSAELDLLAFDSQAQGASCPTDFVSFDSCPPEQFDFFTAAPGPSIINKAGSSDFIDFGDFSSSLPPTPSVPLNPISSATSSSGAISLQSYGSVPPLHNNGNSSFVDPFSSPMVSSVSMPNFPTTNQQPTVSSSAQTNSTQNRTKSNLDLASLYDQPVKSSASSSIISSLNNLNQNGNGLSINNLMHPSQMNSSSGLSQMNRPMGQNNLMMGAQNGAMASNSMGDGMQSMNGNMNGNMNGYMHSMSNGSMQSMNGSMQSMNGSMNGMNGSMNGNTQSMSNGSMQGMSGMNGGMNGHINGNINCNSMQGMSNGSTMGMNGGQMLNGHGQSSAQSFSNSNYSQQQQQQQSYSNQTQQQQQPYRGMVTAGVAPKKPADAFDFVGSSMSSYSGMGIEGRSTILVADSFLLVFLMC